MKYLQVYAMNMEHRKLSNLGSRVRPKKFPHEKTDKTFKLASQTQMMP